ncbi:AAA family ATPase [Enterococcus termitis]|uniref:Nuclease SbcCD subunit C n=1 Tax=Enterococcus termitis TaxID=332950 RepID=A0A1E5GKB9_9ENTE|nr:SMC family ATPase [Enterococcus termitis]OEG13045.1 exonuclease SbcC [Enterococcus termitis]OJG99102.1 exonuclease SbcC [Enterococcus termitis]
MKPLTLTLKNFGPYIDETIDFSTFEDSSLFLISGKTGAGKTTIFDGMSYALFGESSGKLRQGKEMRSTFADPSEPTEVCLAFSHGEHLYEITRKPEQELFKKRGDGTRVQSAKISLIVKDHKGKELREYTKRREVDGFIQELLHLDANQFAQIVLLPQGEFRTFLIANSSDKEKVLRNLFGTRLYQTLNEQLKIQLKTVNKGIEATQQTIEAKLDQLYWQEEIEAQTVEQQLQALERQQKEMQEKQATEKKALSLLEKQKQTKEQEKFQMEELLHAFTKQAELKKQQAELDETAELIETLRIEEQQLQWVKNHQSLIEKIDEKSKAVATYSEQLQHNQAEQEEQQELKQHWEQKQQENEIEAATMTIIKEKINQLQFQIPLYEEKETLIKSIEKNQTELEEITKKLKEIKEQQTLTDQAYQKQAQIIEQQATYEKEQLILEKNQEQWSIFLENWESKEELERKKERLVQEILEKETALKSAEQMKIALYEQVKTQKSQWAKMQISRLSLLLVAGEPCPVCGSTDHPKQDEHQEYSIEEIQAMDTQLDTLEKQAQQQEALTATLQSEVSQAQIAEKELVKTWEKQNEKIHRLTESLKQRSFITLATPITAEGIENGIAELKTAEQQLIQSFEQIKTAKTKIAELEAQVKQQSTVLQQQEKQLEEKQQEQTEAKTKLKTITNQLSDADDSLAEILTEKQQLEQKVAEWETQKKRIETELSKIKENSLLLVNSAQHLLNEKTANLTEQKELEKQLNAALKKSTFNFDEQILRVLIKEVPKLDEITEQLTTFDKKKEQLAFQLTELAQTLEEKEQPETVEITAEIDSLSSLIRSKEELYYQQQEKIQSNEKICNQVKELIASVEQKWEEITALHQLSATINGDNPRKTSLERYVLQTYLEEVLTVANQRLSLLTNNRYQFELDQGSGSYKNQTGLEINVYDDNAGTSRSAHTLSGGESFIAALALALSLAEVIQEQAGGVVIEALFIDEGFGSLDEEALEMAMEALETIENEGRMIGIISHVSELKARIPQQLQIKTNGNGQSQVTYQTA